MSSDGSVSREIELAKEGDEVATQALWERYCVRLIGLARKKLGNSSRRGSDEEDVVQSAFHSFCQRAKAGAFPKLSNRQDLWSLLATIVVRKAINEFNRERRPTHGGGKVAGESLFEAVAPHEGIAAIVGQEPRPSEVVAFVELLEQFMNRLDDPVLRSIAMHKIEGRSNPEIAEQIGSSLSSVERKMRLIRKRLESMLADSDGGYIL